MLRVYVTFSFQDLIDRINSYFQRIAFKRTCFLLVSNTLRLKFFPMKIGSLQWMALHKRVRSNHGGKLPASIKYENLYYF